MLTNMLGIVKSREMGTACFVPPRLCCMAVKWLMRKYMSCWSSLSLRTKEASDHTLMVTWLR